MTNEREMTVAQYTGAFVTWGGVASLRDDVNTVLVSAIAHLRERFNDHEMRKPDVYCAAFDEYLSECDEEPNGPRARLRLAIHKSCLLDRLIHCGEELRKTPCPEHKGRWSGCFAEPCPHGCSIGCGCTTGWLPSLDTAIKACCHAAEHIRAKAFEMAKLRRAESRLRAVEVAVRHERETRATWLSTLPTCATAPADLIAAEAATGIALDKVMR